MIHISSNVSLNTSLDTEDSEGDNAFLSSQLPKLLTYGFSFLLSIVGNSFLVWAVYKDARLKGATNSLIANIAIADLITIIFTTPVRFYEVFHSYEWVFSMEFAVPLCKIVYYPPCFAFFVAIYSCCFIAIDRYYAVVHPLKTGFIQSYLKYFIAAIWFFSVTFSVPLPLYMNIKPLNNGKRYCIMKNLTTVPSMYVMLVLYLIPAIAISVTYPVIAYKLRKHRVPGNQTDSIRKRREQQNKTILLMSLAIVVSLNVTFLFVCVLAISIATNKLASFGVDVSYICLFALHINSCYNFIICMIFNRQYRQNFSTFLSNCYSCCCCVSAVRPIENRPGVAHTVSLNQL